jgi:hypothetical protein
MTTRFRIGLAEPATQDLTSQLRNFGEYLANLLEGKGHLDMKQVDAATDHFWVTVSEKRNLGEVLTALKKRTRPVVSDSHFTLESAGLAVRESVLPTTCVLTPRWSGRVEDKVPGSYARVRAAQLNR